MKVLVINAGSSSLKYKLFDMQNCNVMAAGTIERIGEVQSQWIHNEKIQDIKSINDHKSAMHLAIDHLTATETGVIKSINQIDAIGHRVVQGGEVFTSATLVDDRVKQGIKDNIPLAPLHNPANLMGIEVAEKLLPSIPNIAIFDTEFHKNMPAKAFLYALPQQYYSEYKIRKYGFHGTSHKYVVNEAATALAKNIEDLNLISIHLGNGCSICAIENGQSIDTSMGMTPLSGLVMGSRSGDFDPGVIAYLQKQSGMNMDAIDTVLNTKSGLKGICGLNDMRDVQKAANKGDVNAVLAIEMFCYQVKKMVGAYLAVLGKVDAIIFTGGIGENNGFIRAKCCENLLPLGIEIDDKKNSKNHKTAISFSAHSVNSTVKIMVIPANEELQIAREVMQVFQIADNNL